MAWTESLSGFLSAAAYHFEKNRPFVMMEIHLLVSALFPIYAGAHASLSRPSSAAKPERRKITSEDDDLEEEEEQEHEMEGLSPRDAVIFPITAGIVLAGLYFAIKAYGAAMINLVLGVYFSLIGTFSVAKLVSDSWGFMQSFITPGYYLHAGQLWKLIPSRRKAVALVGDQEVDSRPTPLPGVLGRIPLAPVVASLLWEARDSTKRKYTVKGFMKDSFDFSTKLTEHNALSALLGIAAIGYSLFIDKPWWLTNLQGFAVSYGALQLMSPTTFATGTLILSGLFFYDIWAVFFTPLMVTVAKNLDVPIKLVFPRPDEPSGKPGEPPIKSYSMLGLGDIVLPGLMIALALRFDLYMFYLRKQKPADKRAKEAVSVKKTPYVTATGYWGDKYWTSGKSNNVSSLPAHLQSSFPKPYFHVTLVGYVFGMLLTLGFMTVFQHAQPALLYLVPCVLASLWGTGLVRGELRQMWDFTEAVTGEALDDDRKDSKNSRDVKGEDDKDAESVLSTIWNAVFDKKQEKKSAKEPQKGEPADITTRNNTGVNSGGEKSSVEKSLDGKIFTFEISYHEPTPLDGKETKDANTSKDSDQSQQKDLADSNSDDAIVVTDSDFDSSKEAINLRS